MTHFEWGIWFIGAGLTFLLHTFDSLMGRSDPPTISVANVTKSIVAFAPLTLAMWYIFATSHVATSSMGIVAQITTYLITIVIISIAYSLVSKRVFMMAFGLHMLAALVAFFQLI